jgi:hypothetical protein
MPDGEQSKPQRKWPVTAIGILLMVEAVVLLASVALILALNVPDLEVALNALWEALRTDPLGISTDLLRLPQDALALEVAGERIFIPVEAVVSTWHLPVVLPALIVGLLFLRHWRPAWAAALIVQGALLIIDLRIYFLYRSAYACLLMLFPILLVIYLNHYDVRLAFQSREQRPPHIVRDLTGDSL